MNMEIKQLEEIFNTHLSDVIGKILNETGTRRRKSEVKQAYAVDRLKELLIKRINTFA